MNYLPYILIILLFLACQKESDAPTEPVSVPVGQAFDLKIGKTAAIENAQLSFKFINVPEDSRCPTGALCIWAGNATVVIKVFNALDTLNTSLNPKSVQYGSYLITLIQLNPYPRIGVPRDTTQYVAQFVVTKN
jgi:hypothetical protein